MASNAPNASEPTALPGSSLWDSENMDPNADNRPAERIMVVGECSGDSPTTKESLLKLVAEVYEECCTIRKAVVEFRNIESYVEESAMVAQRRGAAARRKAKRYCSMFEEAEHHRTIANKLSEASLQTTNMAKEFDQLLRVAEGVEESAFLNADYMFRELKKTEESVIEQKAVKGLQNAKKCAAEKATELKNAEYHLLKAMQRCCARDLLASEGEALREGDLTTRLIPIDQTNSGPCEWILMSLAIISGIASCILLILSVIWTLDKSSFIAMLISGVVCTLLSLSYVIYKIAKKRIAKRNLAYIHRRNTILQLIDERLPELTTFFMTKNIDIPSDE